jgi:hypothetical protein
MYSVLNNVIMASPAIQTQTLTVEECKDLCNRWENLPFTSSECVGFNYNKLLSFCFLYDNTNTFTVNNNYDFYERSCNTPNLTGDWHDPTAGSGGYITILTTMASCLYCNSNSNTTG